MLCRAKLKTIETPYSLFSGITRIWKYSKLVWSYNIMLPRSHVCDGLQKVVTVEFNGTKSIGDNTFGLNCTGLSIQKQRQCSKTAHTLEM